MSGSPSAAGSPSYSHLLALSDERGVFEHAYFDVPRRDHGYCVDDVARALIVVTREQDQTSELAVLAETCLGFLEQAIRPDGRVRNRMSADGVWTDDADIGDWWGRAAWATGVAAAGSRTHDARDRALRAFHLLSRVRSPHLRAMAFATLGAVDVLRVHPEDSDARALVEDGAAIVDAVYEHGGRWPEPRLRYANGALPDALIGAGAAMGDADMLSRGLSMLRFLLDIETRGDQLSVTGADGRVPSQGTAQFDQQPIEVAALADACARAYEVTGDPSWRHGVDMAWGWFLGRNDASTPMFDPVTGAGFDGLHSDGRNENRGAESTLAALGTYQRARRLGVLVRTPV